MSGKIDFREQNLQLYAARYPREVKMMTELVMSKEADPTYLRADFETNVIKIDPRAKYVKTLVLVGMADPVIFKKVLTQIPELKEARTIILVENDPDHVRRLFTYSDLVPYLSDTRFHFFFGRNETLLKEGLYEIFKIPPNGNHFLNSLLIFHPAITPSERVFYDKLRDIFIETMNTYQTNLGALDDYMEGVRATAANTELLQTWPGLHELKDKYKDLPCVIVGAGPSLDADIQTLKKYQDRVVIFAVDAAVKPLLAAGIRIDYCTSIERWLDIQSKFWDGIPYSPDLPELIAFPVVHTDVLNAYAGPKRFVYRNYAYYIFWEKLLPKKILHSFSNAGHLAFRCARFMGCSKFILVGMDSSYVKLSDNSYASHCKNTGFTDEGWDIPKTKEELDAKQAKYGGTFEVETNNPDSPKTLSYKFYHKWVFEWTQEVAVLNIFGKIINTALNGAKIEYVPYEPLETVLSPLSSIDPALLAKERSEPNRNVPAIKFPLLLKKLDSYRSRFVRLKKLLNSVDRQDTQFMIFLQGYMGILLRDMFFISMIAQNCTRENCQISNSIAYLSLDPANDTKEEREARIKLAEVQLDLYTKVCDDLRKAVDDGLGSLYNEEEESSVN